MRTRDAIEAYLTMRLVTYVLEEVSLETWIVMDRFYYRYVGKTNCSTRLSTTLVRYHSFSREGFRLHN